YFDVHPRDPQPRSVGQVVDLIRNDGLVVYPTDSCYAFGSRMDNASGPERIRTIRQLSDRHDFTLVCADMSQIGAMVYLGNAEFRAIKAATPGPYTFILQATKEVPRRLRNPRKKTVGVRIPDHPVPRALLRELGEPMLSSTVLLPGDEDPMTEGWQIKDELDHVVDAVVDAGDCGLEPTTVVDFSSGAPEVVRVGAGDPAPFQS